VRLRGAFFGVSALVLAILWVISSTLSKC